jgi:non-heme chloroperoxidase
LITHPRGKAFRAFAERTKSDRVALAACVIGARQLFTVEDLQAIKNRVLVAVGTEDDVAGDGGKLAAALPNGEYLPIPGRDHMKAVGDRTHIRGVLDFLAGD